MRVRSILTTGIVLGAVATGGAAVVGEPEYTSDFGLAGHHVFLPNSSNTWFPIKPGQFRRYEGEEDGELIELEITVLSDIEVIFFEVDGEGQLAICRVVEEREWEDSELVEVSRNFFARSRKSQSVFYFGEDVDIYEDGVIIGHEGAWRAGEDGALPGLIMAEMFLLGSRYYQELAPGVALDRAENVEMGLTVETEAGTFENCVRVRETSELDPDEVSIKLYAPGIGLIIDDELELVEWRD